MAAAPRAAQPTAHPRELASSLRRSEARFPGARMSQSAIKTPSDVRRRSPPRGVWTARCRAELMFSGVPDLSPSLIS